MEWVSERVHVAESLMFVMCAEAVLPKEAGLTQRAEQLRTRIAYLHRGRGINTICNWNPEERLIAER